MSNAMKHGIDNLQGGPRNWQQITSDNVKQRGMTSDRELIIVSILGVICWIVGVCFWFAS